MSRYSSFKCFDEFLRNGIFDVKTQEDIDNIPEELFDRHANRETDFGSWKSMLDRANEEYSAGHRFVFTTPHRLKDPKGPAALAQ